MASRIRETDDDREMERRILDQFEVAWQCEMYQTPRLSPFDAWCIRYPTLHGIVEAKRRWHYSTAHDTLIIDWAKIDSALKLARWMGKPFYLLIGWNDRLGWVQPRDDYPVRKGGTKKRGDPLDIDDVVDIPISEFRMIEWDH